MKELQLDENKRALAIVAHPDDETIWMGGVLQRYPRIKWTIFSLCRASDADRAPKFQRVCAHYGAKCLIADLDDAGMLDLAEAEAEAKKIITKNLVLADFDYVFTHGENGEYGHERHIVIHRAFADILKTAKKKPEAVFYFAYEKSNGKMIPAVGSLLLSLNEAELFEKKRIVSEMHGYPLDGIDVGYCTEVEAFQMVDYK